MPSHDDAFIGAVLPKHGLTETASTQDESDSAVADYLNGGNWSLVKEFVEVESGKRSDRPMLAKAVQACRAYNAKLVIAKLDRLSRDAHFLLGLEKAGVDFVAADMPNANRLPVGIMAMVAEEERRMISKRTKDALSPPNVVAHRR